MRIAFDLHATVGRATGIGVVARSIWTALESLAPEDVELVPLGLDGPGAMPGTLRRLWWEQVELPARIAASGADWVHLTGFAVPWRRPRPVLLTVHDLIGMRLPVKGFGARAYWGRILPATIPWARALVAVSEATKADCVELLGVPAERVHVVPNGVDRRFRPPTDEEMARVRSRHELPGDYVLAVASMAPRKNLPLLVEAFAALAMERGRGTLRLVLAGKAAGDEGAIRERVTRLGLGERIRMLGYVADEDLPALYGGARVFAYPSSYEGFGLPVLEALACGVPALTTRSSALPEAGGDLARYVDPPPTAAAIAAALRDMLDDDALRRRVAVEGPERAAAFTWEAAARRLVEIYRSLAPSEEGPAGARRKSGLE